MYDAVFIGGGLNYAGAIVLAKNGKKVALVQNDMSELGGVCLHHGCIPSKNLLHRSKTILETKESVFGSHKERLKLEVLQDKIQKHLKNSTDSIKLQCKAAGVKLIEAQGYITDQGVEIDGEIVESRYVMLGTGSDTFLPNGIEVDGKHIITSKEALKLKKFPKEIVIYGSGAIGLEMASFFATNGVKTSLMFRGEKISKKIDPVIVERLEEQLKNIGINLISKCSIDKAKIQNDKVEVFTSDGKSISTDMLLVATGRVPNISAIKTDRIKIDKKVVTDEFFQTTIPDIFAIGDCNGKLMLAHAARAEVLNVVDNILGKREVLNLSNIPKFIYTMPLSYAFVGVKSSTKATFPLSYLGIKSAVEGSDLGVVILYVDSEGFVSGAELFAPNAEELIGIITTALAAELDVKSFKRTVFPHPTFSESIDRVLRRV